MQKLIKALPQQTVRSEHATLRIGYRLPTRGSKIIAQLTMHAQRLPGVPMVLYRAIVVLN
jgi:hypothetical protein